MKRIIIIFSIATFLLLQALNLYADRNGYVRRVVIDPGHGGRDSGAIGKTLGTLEKDIVLNVSLMAGKMITDYFDDVEVFFTRESDVFVKLSDRARIANENKADLFISVHCNSFTTTRPFGAETFVMGLHRSQENLEVARKENAAILYEDDYLETYDGYDPNSPESNIIFTLYQNAYLDQSLTMASMMQSHFSNVARRHDRGVKQAGFLVLYRVTMPAILIEAGFLSNEREERFLASEQGQREIAKSIFKAFRDYKIAQDELAKQRSAYAYGRNNDISQEKGMNSAEAETAALIPSAGFSEGSDAVRLSFRVQFASTSTERSIDDPVFEGLANVSYYFHEGLYKYTVGDAKSPQEAAEIQKNVHDKGFRDAFVVAFKNNERISATEALRIFNEKQQNK